MKSKFIFSSLLLSAFLLGCHPEEGEEVVSEKMGYRPVYGTSADLEVQKLPAREMCQPGKIYIYGSYLFVNEVQQGIHIIDNSDPKNPQPLSFLKIVGNVDMAVRNGYLYADHINSLVVMDIREPQNPKFVKAVEQTFDTGHDFYPPVTGVPFECVEPGKGVVIGWTEALLKNPKCFR